MCNFRLVLKPIYAFKDNFSSNQSWISCSAFFVKRFRGFHSLHCFLTSCLAFFYDWQHNRVPDSFRPEKFISRLTKIGKKLAQPLVHVGPRGGLDVCQFWHFVKNSKAITYHNRICIKNGTKYDSYFFFLNRNWAALSLLIQSLICNKIHCAGELRTSY